MGSHSTRRNRTIVAVRFQRQLRQVFRLTQGDGEFYVVLNSTDWLEWHYSYHRSGQRHVRMKLKGSGGAELRLPPWFVSRVRPIADFRGVELICGGTILKGTFHRLPECDATGVETLILDADAALFRDDIMFARVFLVEPGLEPEIPCASSVGPKLLYLTKTASPWVGIAFFQQRPTAISEAKLEGKAAG